MIRVSPRAVPVAALALLVAGALGCGVRPRPGVERALEGDGLELTLRALDGTTLELASLRGRVVLVDVWATWCGPCLRALPGLARLSTSRPDDLVVVGLSTDDDRRSLEGFLRDNPLPYFVAVADRESLATFRTAALPTVFVLDRQGRLRESVVGAVPESALLATASRYF